MAESKAHGDATVSELMNFAGENTQADDVYLRAVRLTRLWLPLLAALAVNAMLLFGGPRVGGLSSPEASAELSDSQPSEDESMGTSGARIPPVVSSTDEMPSSHAESAIAQSHPAEAMLDDAIPDASGEETAAKRDDEQDDHDGFVEAEWPLAASKDWNVFEHLTDSQVDERSPPQPGDVDVADAVGNELLAPDPPHLIASSPDSLRLDASAAEWAAAPPSASADALEGLSRRIGARLLAIAERIGQENAGQVLTPVSTVEVETAENGAAEGLTPSIAASATAAEAQEDQKTPSRALLINPVDSGGNIHYLVNGKVHTLVPGESHQLDTAGPCVVRFHRGGDFGDSEVPVTEGGYRFVVTDRGWELSRSTPSATPDG